MKENKQINFIKAILQSTIAVEVNIVAPPFDNLSIIDRSLRKTIWKSIDYYTPLKNYFSNLANNTICCFRDNFNSHYAILKLPGSTTYYLCIGPFLLEETDDDFYNKVIMKNSLNNDMLLPLKHYYNNIPFIDSRIISSSLQAIGCFLFEDENNFKIIYMEEFQKGNDLIFDFVPNPDVSLTMKILEDRYKNENILMEAISKGDRITGLEYLSKLANMKLTPRTNDPIRNFKNQAIILNVLCRKAAEKNFIHPVYLDEISTKFAIELEKLTTNKALNDLINEMIKKYCLIVQNHSLKEYSPLVRKTLNYINFNLSKPISLKIIAEEFSVNPNYLSTIFKKEVDVTLTDYINNQRINLAVRLLNTSDMQIQNIAWYVGINDVNYFTKLFKKRIGHTPTEYKKNIKSNVLT